MSMPTGSLPRVCVIGLGYIGLPTAAVLARCGHHVTGVDIDRGVLRALTRGQTRVREPGLPTLVAQLVREGRLIGADGPAPADVFLIAVPTPLRGMAHKRADLSYVTAATRAVAPLLQPGNLVVLESTSPPGTTETVVRPILEEGSGLRAGHDFHLAHCPERVLPGRILEELVENDRIIGGIDRASADAARRLYASFVRGEILLTDATTAEVVKLMENTHRDVNIALSNEFALVAEHLGVDIWEAIELANRHPRVRFLRPGPGVGGHCIAVDPWFIVGAAPQFTPLITASRGVNDAMPLHVADLVADVLGGLDGARLLALGLTYKADVDDIRESPAAEVIAHLRHAGAEVRVHDAMVDNSTSVEDLSVETDCLLLLVDHTAYVGLNAFTVGRHMRRRIVVDTRNFLTMDTWVRAGFSLVRLGDGRHRTQAEALVSRAG